jgi:DNA sulfur modification protein DndC
MNTTPQLTSADIVLGGATVGEIRREIQRIYLADKRPWVLGFSGGKDSTAILRLVFESLIELPKVSRIKPVFIVSSDTLVETPMIVDQIGRVLATVQHAAIRFDLPLSVAQVTPEASDTFWVNLLGKGYPAPTRSFRWCTERLKIDPVSEFIRSKVAAFGEVTVVLGSRAAESSSRAQVMKKHRIEGSRLARHTSLVNAYVYTPIESWSADDVWEFLFSGPAPWGGDHQELFDLYKDSNAGECPLVIDTTTPSCGNSRFGCWVCTVVTQDRSMDGLVESGHTWLVPLKDFRNELFETTKPENKKKFRSDKRRNGKVTIKIQDDLELKHVLGPYRMDIRHELLRKLLQTQRDMVRLNPEATNALITKFELEEIRLCWRTDPNEPDWTDAVPRIYREVMGEDLDWIGSDRGAFGGLEESILAEIQIDTGIPKELIMKLIETELAQEGLSRKTNLFRRFDAVFDQDWDEIDVLMTKQKGRESQAAEYERLERTLQGKYAQVTELLANDL